MDHQANHNGLSNMRRVETMSVKRSNIDAFYEDQSVDLCMLESVDIFFTALIGSFGCRSVQLCPDQAPRKSLDH